VIDLLLAILLAATERPLDRIERMKPVAVEAADSPLRKLQKQRYNERLAGVQKWLGSYRQRNCERPPILPLVDLLSQLGLDGAALEATPAGRVKQYEFRAALLRDVESFIQGLLEVGQNRPQDLNYARAARIDAQIELIRLRDALKVAGDEQLPAKLGEELHPQIKFHPLVIDATKPDEKDTPLRKLQKQRVRDRALYLAKMQIVIKIGNWYEAEHAAHQQTHWLLAENLAELMEKPADKIKCHEMRVEALKEFEKMVTESVKVGKSRPQSLNLARAARIDAEVELLKLKESLKAGK
jgi:hypothetical protein